MFPIWEDISNVLFGILFVSLALLKYLAEFVSSQPPFVPSVDRPCLSVAL